MRPKETKQKKHPHRTGLKRPEEINPHTKITKAPPTHPTLLAAAFVSLPPRVRRRVPTIVFFLCFFFFRLFFGGFFVFTRVRAQVPLQGGVAGEGALAVAADVAVHAGVDLHVLLQGLLGLEALCTQQTEHRHVSPWRTAQKTQTQLFQ